MSNMKEECELKHLVIPDEEQIPYEITPSICVMPGSVHITQTCNIMSSAKSNEHSSETRSSSRNNTPMSALSSQSGHQQARDQHSNEKLFTRSSEKPPRPPPPVRALNKRAISSSHVPLVHHSFLSDVTDVRQMEHALLTLLEDFQTGKLRAFGKDCSMEQMTGIREQQEHLARIHFELGAQQELFAPLSDEGLSQGTDNMYSLMSKLERLSLSIERLHSFSNNSMPD